ncbi:unnamed protein product [Colletotrichum noveboracense]|uniref:Uncharacterized protein n=1 Tax=Colletotrichum noveboracense TaxID=2664923 RepID=A0A9W4S615_9PEZI|nr:unnamed protein product [Colletotrichum noveboracense]
MSERKVLQKYYPPDFNPADITRKRGPKSTGPKCQTVRIMAPYSMKDAPGRTLSGHPNTPLFDPLHQMLLRDRFPYRPQVGRLHDGQGRRAEHGALAQQGGRTGIRRGAPGQTRARGGRGAGEEERNAMADLEAKNEDARREMAAADALDEIRQRNARIQRSEKDGVDFADYVVRPEDEEKARLEREDDEAARKAFAAARERAAADLGEEIIEDDVVEEPVAGSSASSSTAKSETVAKDTSSMPPPPPPPAKRTVKKKKDYSAALGIKKKPSLV